MGSLEYLFKRFLLTLLETILYPEVGTDFEISFNMGLQFRLDMQQHF